MRKKRVGRYPMEFRRKAVKRMKECNNITALAAELGLERRLLYDWKDQLEPDDGPIEKPREGTVKELNHLKRVLAEKTLELDFFKGALQKIEARRRQSGVSGEKASTTKSGK